MKKVLLKICLLLFVASAATAQTLPVDSVAIEGSAPFTPSNYRFKGTSVSNFSWQFLWNGKYIKPVTSYQFNRFLPARTKTYIDSLVATFSGGSADNGLYKATGNIFQFGVPLFSGGSVFTESREVNIGANNLVIGGDGGGGGVTIGKGDGGGSYGTSASGAYTTYYNPADNTSNVLITADQYGAHIVSVKTDDSGTSNSIDVPTMGAATYNNGEGRSIVLINPDSTTFVDNSLVHKKWVQDRIAAATGGGVTSVNTRTGDVVLDKGDVNLPDVDNTSDADKPISTATAAALATKQPILVSNVNIKRINGNTILGPGNITLLDSALNKPLINKAVLLSKPTKVYVISGESNAAGAVLGSQITPADTVTRQNIFILNNNNLRLEKLKIGTNNNLQGGANGRFGWELQLAQSTAPTDTIYIIKTGISRQNIAKLIDSLPHTLALIDTAMKQIRALNKTPVPYILYSQGINDSPQNYPLARKWKNNTMKYIKTIREHVGYAPVFMTKFDPAIVYGYLNGQIDTIATYQDNFTQAIPTLGLPTNVGEPQHWNRAGDSTIVLRMLASITQNVGPIAGYANLSTGKAGTLLNYRAPIITADSLLSTKNEIAYQTKDQQDNPSYIVKEFTANGYDILSKANGTGIPNSVNIGLAANQQLQIKQGVLDKFTFTGGTLTASSGSQSYLSAFPTINQTSTAGYTGFNLTAYLQGVGSGANNLFALRTSTAANGGGTVTDRFTVNGSGLVTSAGGYLYGLASLPANHGVAVGGGFIGVDRAFGLTFLNAGSPRSFIGSNTNNDINITTSSGGSISFVPAAIQKEWINAQGHGFGTGLTNPQAQAHFSAETASSYSAPIKFTVPAAVTTTAESQVLAPTTTGDKLTYTIATGIARKEITLNDVALNSGIVPVTTTNGRLTNTTVTTTEIGYVSGVSSGIQAQLNLKAPLASPALTGTPTAPTASAATNTTQIATTAYVKSQGYYSATDTVTTVVTKTFAARYVPTNSAASLQRLSVNGTGGNGYLDLISQSVSPATLTGHLRLYSDSLNRLSWKNSTYRRTIQVPMTTDVTIRMPYLTNPTLVDSTQADGKFLKLSTSGAQTILNDINVTSNTNPYGGSFNINGYLNSTTEQLSLKTNSQDHLVSLYFKAQGGNTNFNLGYYPVDYGAGYSGVQRLYVYNSGITTNQSNNGGQALLYAADLGSKQQNMYRAITAATTIDPTSDYTIDVTSGTFTQPLPIGSVSGLGQIYIIKNSGAGVVTVSGGGTIDGASSVVINPGDAPLQVQQSASSGAYKRINAVTSAGGGTYTAGNGLTLTSTVFSADTAILAPKNYVNNFASKAFAAATYTPQTRTINNGYGLTGFGNLSADRTPAVDSTTVGTRAYTQNYTYSKTQSNGLYAPLASPTFTGTPKTPKFILSNITTGLGGTDSLLVKKSSDNQIYKIPANYYPAASVSLRFQRYTASGNGSSTTISVPHGISGITSASSVSVEAMSAAAAGKSYVTVDATNVNIFYTVAPASGTNNLLYTIGIKP